MMVYIHYQWLWNCPRLKCINHDFDNEGHGKNPVRSGSLGSTQSWSLGMAEGRRDNDLTLKNHLCGRWPWTLVTGHTQERVVEVDAWVSITGVFNSEVAWVVIYLQCPTFLGGQERSELKTGKPFVVYYSESLTRVFPPPPSVPERVEYPHH